MIKVGLLRYYNTEETVTKALDSCNHYDLIVCITHLPRQGETVDNSYNLVNDWIAKNTSVLSKLKAINVVYPHEVYPGWTKEWMNKQVPIEKSVASYNQFGYELLKTLVLLNKYDISDIVYAKIDADIIELSGESWYNLNKDILLKGISTRSPIYYFGWDENKNLFYRDNLFENIDYFTLSGDVLFNSSFIQTEKFELLSVTKNTSRIKAKNVNNVDFIHIQPMWKYKQSLETGYVKDIGPWKPIEEFPQFDELNLRQYIP